MQRVWDLLLEENPSLSYNRSWEIVLDGETWGGSNVFDLLKAMTSTEKQPSTELKYLNRMQGLIKKANVPEAILGRRPLGKQEVKDASFGTFDDRELHVNNQRIGTSDDIRRATKRVGTFDDRKRLLSHKGVDSNQFPKYEAYQQRPKRMTKRPQRYEDF